MNLVLVHLSTRHARNYPWTGSQRSVDLGLTIFSLRTGIASRGFDSGDGLDEGGLASTLVSETTDRADALELSGSVLAVSFNDPHPIQYL